MHAELLCETWDVSSRHVHSNEVRIRYRQPQAAAFGRRKRFHHNRESMADKRQPGRFGILRGPERTSRDDPTSEWPSESRCSVDFAGCTRTRSQRWVAFPPPVATNPNSNSRALREHPLSSARHCTFEAPRRDVTRKPHVCGCDSKRILLNVAGE